MHLYASLVASNRDRELFAVLDVESDTARQHDPDHFKRDVVGKLRQRGPIWDDYLQAFGDVASVAVAGGLPPYMRPFTEDGRAFLTVKGLQVDYDFYGLHSWLNVEQNVVRLTLIERFNGTADEYYETVSERNRRVQSLVDRVHSGKFTVNDLRHVMGESRGPQFEYPLSADLLQTMLDSRHWREATRNLVV